MGERRTSKSFGTRLALIVAVGFVLRGAAALWLDAHTAPRGDALWYLDVARLVARGPGFVEPVTWLSVHRRLETAAHPPLYPLYLSVLDLTGTIPTLLFRVWSFLPSALTIALSGLVARDLAGSRAGLLAAGAAAVSLPLLFQDVDLYSEGLFAAAMLVVVWGCYRLAACPSARRAALLGAAVGLAALTRAEGLLMMVVVAIVVIQAGDTWTTRARRLLAGLAGLTIVLAPWFVYNLTRFERPVVLSTALGPLVWSSNCRHTYEGRNVGGWGYICPTNGYRFTGDESAVDEEMRDLGVDYASRHVGRLPVVVLVRVMRTFGLWHPNRMVDETLELEHAGLGALVVVTVAQYVAFVVIGAVGYVWLRRRRRLLAPLLGPVVIAFVVTVCFYGSFRFRIGLDAVLPVFVGVGAARWSARRPAGSGARGGLAVATAGPSNGSCPGAPGTLET